MICPCRWYRSPKVSIGFGTPGTRRVSFHTPDFGQGIAASLHERTTQWQTNGFESSRISDGTLHAGAQHVTNLPSDTNRPVDPTYNYSGQGNFLNGHTVRTGRVCRVLGSTTLTGANVRNPAGDSLGKIEDIMIGLAQGQIAYAVLSFGGLFGIGSKLLILPWGSLTHDRRQNEFILDIQRDVLEKGPAFDRENWPDMADPTYGTDVHRHYGKTPYWENTMTDFSSDEFTANRCCE